MPMKQISPGNRGGGHHSEPEPTAPPRGHTRDCQLGRFLQDANLHVLLMEKDD